MANDFCNLIGSPSIWGGGGGGGGGRGGEEVMYDVTRIQLASCVLLTCWLISTTAMSLRLVKLLKVSSMSPTDVSVGRVTGGA